MRMKKRKSHNAAFKVKVVLETVQEKRSIK